MIALLQRVRRASVTVSDLEIATIGKGLLILLGVAKGDTLADLEKLLDKISTLRVFPDEEGKLNHDLLQAGGSVLCVSQFTLLADCRKGRRPGFSQAEIPELAKPMWELFCTRLATRGIPVERGQFGADMQLSLINDGPLTIHLDSRS